MNVEQLDYYDAFISYRHHSGFYLANLIYEKLVYNGYNVFIDKNLRSAEVGYENQIKNAIYKSKNFLIVLFPDDLNNSTEESDWLRKEANWAADAKIHRIPILCEHYKPDGSQLLPDGLLEAIEKHGIEMHKDYSLDRDLDMLCDEFLKNAAPVKPMINTKDFFSNNLHRHDVEVKRVDLAFHAGENWLRSAVYMDILDEMIDNSIPLRIMINTPQAALAVAKTMRRKGSIHTSFENMADCWRDYCDTHPGLIEVRACDIPLLHIYHAIEYLPDNNSERKKALDRIHLKYYVHNNSNVENSFEHELSSCSKYYPMYKNEFEYLWENSLPIYSSSEK